jgi:hypothetical protein
MMTSIDIALLTAECSTGDDSNQCPCCLKYPQIEPHKPGCSMDLALSERGWNTRAERDAARARIQFTSQPTLPPPPKESP